MAHFTFQFPSTPQSDTIVNFKLTTFETFHIIACLLAALTKDVIFTLNSANPLLCENSTHCESKSTPSIQVILEVAPKITVPPIIKDCLPQQHHQQRLTSLPHKTLVFPMCRSRTFRNPKSCILSSSWFHYVVEVLSINIRNSMPNHTSHYPSFLQVQLLTPFTNL